MSAWPRFKFYGTPRIFLQAAGEILGGTIHKGDDVARLEAEIARLTGRRHAIATPQARVGLFLILEALLARTERRKVVLSPYTIYDVVNMVVCARGVPVFADVDPRTGNLDPDQVAALIDDGVAAVLSTHLHGIMADLGRLAAVCEAAGIPLLEDAAQAFGGRWQGRAAGGVGHAAMFSLGRAKNINCFYGGVVVTDDDALAASIRAHMADWPDLATSFLVKRIIHCAIIALAVSRAIFPWLTRHVFRSLAIRGERKGAALFSTERNPLLRSHLPPDWQRRLTPMQARMALDQLRRADADQVHRLRLARLYRDGLADLPQVGLPRPLPGADDIFMPFPIQVADRLALQEYLLNAGLDVVVQHIGNCADYPVFAPFHRDCPQARQVAKSVLLLPTYPEYPEVEARRIVRAIRDFYKAPPES
ncbi:putative PLP-dependent enzyme possibly involved in cell wall biogenesis [Magnetospirillum sp. XM-1]|uniref:DegT/DnrJ/EryC1/StrS family aminotransferase n=1 Tax=Magnetospirillum sp. XM-1 TaxID=1663591 RepID=UPI00073DC4B4|nr:DegT/DnrJ/EryC1/StrS family aminotransferase [Magnetospirillum sp. XM-1]CUW38071.1 putative PLP-dependent enzyme possibly involved in cell wall biogenesis [Magnetospirillum sp. XM-1]